MCLFLGKVLSRCILKSGIAGSYGSSMYRFLHYLHTVLHSGCTNLTSPPTVQEGSLFSTPLPAFVILDFIVIAILTCVRWYLIVVLICISLINRDVEHFFMCLFVICISSLEKCLFRSFAHFPLGGWLFCC